MKKFLLSAFAAVACMTFASAEEVVLDFTTNQYGQIVGDSKNENYLANKDNSTYTFSADVVSITCKLLDGKSGVRFYQGEDKDGNKTYISLRVNNGSGISFAVDGSVITNIVFDGVNLNAFKGEGYSSTESEAGTFTGSANSVDLQSDGKTVQIKKMTVTYEVGGTADERQNAGLVFSEESAIAYLGEEFTAPTLTAATTAVITYSSDKEEVATVDAATGKVTLVGEGTARITATAEANDDFRAGSASYLLTVRPAKVEGAIFSSEMGEGFSFENPADAEVWKLDSRYGLKASAYINNTQVASEAIAYTTEAIDLTSYTKATLTFSQAMNQFKLNNELIDVDAVIDYAKLVVREAGATEWTEIGEATAPEKFSWDYYENAPVDLSDYCGKKIQFGFKYISTSSVAGTWEIKNVNVTAEGGEKDSIAEINAQAGNGVIYDLQGRRVIAPARGLYIVNGKVVRF